MKILVYGCGVIGSYLVHILCKSGNDVTVVSKGKWGEILKTEGLVIHHQLQHKDTVDFPHITKELTNDHYDVVFSVMQGCQQRAVLPELAKANTPIVVLVGNNPEAADDLHCAVAVGDALLDTDTVIRHLFQRVRAGVPLFFFDAIQHEIFCDRTKPCIEAAFAGKAFLCIQGAQESLLRDVLCFLHMVRERQDISVDRTVFRAERFICDSPVFFLPVHAAASFLKDPNRFLSFCLLDN